MTKKITFLGIETSCDETAAAVIRENDKYVTETIITHNKSELKLIKKVVSLT